MTAATLAIIVHVIVWHANGTYTRMYEMAAEGKAYLSILYNLGLVLITAGILAFLIETIMSLVTETRQARKNGTDTEKGPADE